MSTSAPRWIVVDDTATDLIQYSGPWFADTSGSQDGFGFLGPVYQETLHGANNDASFSFAFTGEDYSQNHDITPLTGMTISISIGSQVKVHGTNNVRNDSGILDPVWECFVDNVSIGASPPASSPLNNWEFCNSQSKLSDGPHVLTLNATVAKSQTFWIDQIQYIPSASVPVDNLTILVDSLDSQIAGAYGAGWQSLGASANMTTVTGSLFIFDFIGVSLSWYGFIPDELPNTATTGTYTIDGQSPNSFFLKGLSGADASFTQYNQKFFQTPTLSSGKHQLIVNFLGSSTTTPLTLDYLVIQNASIASAAAAATTPTTTRIKSVQTAAQEATTTPGSPATSTSISSGNSNSGKSDGKSHIGAIAGSIIGGVVILLAVLMYLQFIRRRNRGPRSRMTEQNVDAALAMRPFVYAAVSPIETSSNTRRRGKGSGQVARNQSLSSSALGASPQSHVAAQTPTSTLPSVDVSVALRYVHHADSGIRLPSAEETEHIVDLPPEYTLS